MKSKLVYEANKRNEERFGVSRDMRLRVVDIDWPSQCPALGSELDYTTPFGGRADILLHNLPSLDRLDNAQPYVRGNVFVISLRANQIKNNASAEELRRVADYAQLGMRVND